MSYNLRNLPDAKFAELINKIIEFGDTTEGNIVRPKYKDGTPAHTLYLNHHIETWDVSDGYIPITTLRPIAWKSAIKEYLWIFQDQTSDLSKLQARGVNYWNDWDIGDGTIGTRYGETIKKYNQINRIISSIKEQPYTRRHIIDMYQFADFEESKGLYPCLFLHSFTVRGDKLDLISFQRSSDILVAGHVNIIQSIALLHMIAKATKYNVGKFTWVVDNIHIYDRNIPQAKELYKRFYDKIYSKDNKTPHLLFNPQSDNFYNFKIEDFELIDYNINEEHTQLKFELAI